MSNIQDEQENNNLVYSKINNGLNDEEIIINDKDQETESYHYYQSNKLFNNKNNCAEGESEEDSDDSIVAFQEEKYSNFVESKDNIFSKESTNTNEINIEYEKETKDFISENKLIKAKSNEINNNMKIKNSFSNKINLKKTKKKKKKEKEEKIEIYAQDKKFKQIK